MTSVSTHILDTAAGKPREGISVSLQMRSATGWKTMANGVTDQDGRVSPLADGLTTGTYLLVFEPGSANSPLYPEIHIVFDLDEDQPHYHLPLLLSPYGYTTYRGS